MKNILHRTDFQCFIDKNNLKKTIIAKYLSVSNAFVTQLVNGSRDIPNDKLALIKANDEWDVSMFGKDNNSPLAISENNGIGNEWTGTEYTLVPMYNFDAVGGMHTGNEVVDVSDYIDRYVPFADAYNDDICIPISGNSMIPVYPPGCIVLLREACHWKDYFGFGNDFVLILNDGRRLIKNVRKVDADTVRCISYNKDYDDEELPKSFICKVFRIIKVLINVDF